MNTKKEPNSAPLIQQARQALIQGKEELARELALLATANPAQEEQAWLILASLSEPKQAMGYIESALKVNPNSLAARKAIRLVYSQMATGSQAQSQPPVIPPIKPLEDTSPIPIPDDAVLVNLNDEEFLIAESLQMESEEPPEEQGIEAPHEVLAKTEETAEPTTVEEVEPSSATVNKEVLRRKLRQRKSPKAEELPQETPAQIEDESRLKPARKKKFKIIQKTIPEADIETAQSIEIAEVIEVPEVVETEEPVASAEIQEESPSEEPEPQALETPSVPEAESQPEKPMEAQKPDEISEASDEQPEEIHAAAPVSSPVSVPNEPQSEQPAEALPPAEAESIPSQKEQQPTQAAEEKLYSARTTRKVAVNKPAQDSHIEQDYAIDGISKHNNKQDPANVDTIELILVSIAAILLPLLVFLYFYLTK